MGRKMERNIDMQEEYRLRELKEKDCEGMLEWMHNPETNQFYTDKIRRMTPEDVKQFILKSRQLAEQGVTYHYAMVNSKDENLGTNSIKDIDPVKGAEYAISMRPGLHGQGIASWATREILGIAFKTLKLRRVYLNVLSDNEHANRFYLKNGFRYEGEFRSCIMINGQMKSLKWYAMLEEEYVYHLSHL